MSYEELAKLFYKNDFPDRYAWLDKQAEYRRNMPSSFTVGVTSERGELFVAMPTELLTLYEHILRTERKVSQKMRALPLIAQFALTRSLVLDEVVGTNAIEDIHSTRQQIEDALDSVSSAPDKYASGKRFKELAKLYLDLSVDKQKRPTTVEEVRAIYDKATAGEIAADKLPDGEIFRAQEVNVVSGGTKIVHKGVMPEAAIIKVIKAMLALTQREDVPEVIAVIASHYLFEYAHPFYDGNGRTGRYLLSLFLSEALSAPTVLSLSRVISENRNVYYAAFASAEKSMNKGELTFFVWHILELIRTAQLEILHRIEENAQLLQVVVDHIEAVKNQNYLTIQESALILTLAQFELFGLIGLASLDELAGEIDLGKQMARSYLHRLEEKGLVKLAKRRPLRFAVTDKARHQLGI